MQTENISIVQVKITDLKPSEYNPRQASEKECLDLKNSIQRFGLVDPIIVNSNPKRKNIIIGGHFRCRMATELGYQEVPVVYINISDLDKERELNVRLNKNSGSFDYDLLANFDEDVLKDIGFDSKELDKIFQLDTKPEDDEVPEARTTNIKLGDLFKLGEHRLFCGDSTQRADVERLMAGEKADMVFTDPPYGINLDTDWTNLKGSDKGAIAFKKMGGGNKYAKVIGDDVDFEPAFIFDLFDYCKEIFLWGADYYIKKLPDNGCLIIWDKRLTESADLMMGSPFEVLWSKFKHRKEIIRVKWAGIYGLSTQDIRHRVHPTQKPIEVNTWVIEKYTDRDNIVADIFGGSGSTLIACEKLNRKCRMIEIDPIYCQVIIDRWEKFTNGHAERITRE